jgi:hypothetical protein
MQMLLAALVLTLSASAQEDDLVAKRDAKLKSEFLKKADWITDYDKALEKAKSTGKVMFTVFSRSYAPCPACHQLENGPLLEEDFVKFSKDYVLFLHVTTMIPGEKYGDLLEQKGGYAFPWIVFMDATGEILFEHMTERSAAGFAKTGEQAKAYVALKEKAAKGDAPSKIDLAIQRLTMLKATVAETDQALKEAGAAPTESQQSALDVARTNVQLREEVKAVRTDAQLEALKARFYARFKEGKQMPTNDFVLQNYCLRVLEASAEQKDPDTYAGALKVLRDRYGKEEQLIPFFEERDKELKELRATKK